MSTTPETLIDALKQAVDALQLCRSQLYHDGVMIDASHPKRIAATAAENCIVKIADILAAANAAPTEQAPKIPYFVEPCPTCTTVRMCQYNGCKHEPTEQDAPVLDAAGEHDHNQHNKMTLAVLRVLADQNGDNMTTPVVAGKCVDAVLAALSQTIAEDEPQECGTGAMCCWVAAMRDHEEEKAQELPVLSDEEKWQLLDGLREAVSDFRKSTYEFAKRGYQDDFQLMIEAQKRIFDEARALLSRKPADGGTK